MEIRLANGNDLKNLVQNDKHISKEETINKIKAGHIYIAEENGIFLGWLRYGLFWDKIPFINMVYVLYEYRNRRIGSSLIALWEKDMSEQGFEMVMTSSQANEEGQHFYRKLAYKDTGGLLLPGQPLEIFFIKSLDI